MTAFYLLLLGLTIATVASQYFPGDGCCIRWNADGTCCINEFERCCGDFTPFVDESIIDDSPVVIEENIVDDGPVVVNDVNAGHGGWDSSGSWNGGRWNDGRWNGDRWNGGQGNGGRLNGGHGNGNHGNGWHGTGGRLNSGHWNGAHVLHGSAPHHGFAHGRDGHNGHRDGANHHQVSVHRRG